MSTSNESAYSPYHPTDQLTTNELAYSSQPPPQPEVELINPHSTNPFDDSPPQVPSRPRSLSRPHTNSAQDDSSSTTSTTHPHDFEHHQQHKATFGTSSENAYDQTNRDKNDAHIIAINQQKVKNDRKHSHSEHSHDDPQSQAIEHVVVEKHTVDKPRHTFQILYPIFFLLLTTCFIIMALVPRWENQTANKYRSLRPLLLTAMGCSAVMFGLTLAHTIWLLISGRSRWHNSQKKRSQVTMGFYLVSFFTTGIISVLFIAAVLIMALNFNEFHKIIDMLSGIVWWCCGLTAVVALCFLNTRNCYDLIQMCRRPPGDVVIA